MYIQSDDCQIHNMELAVINVIKRLPRGREGLRASITFFLLEAEIDELLAALNSLAKQRSKTR